MSSHSDPSPHESEVPRPWAADELLPPVEPPSASFILQLFVVPAVIVLVVLLLGMLVTSLANTGDRDPAEIVAALRSSSQSRWQEAFELANVLRTEKGESGLRYNEQFGSELAKLLREEHEIARTDDNSVKLRAYLAGVLGALQIDAGLDTLLTVAAEDQDVEVRRKAINAIAILAENFGTKNPPQPLVNERLVPAMIEFANDENDIVRTEAAFALGSLTRLPEADPQLDEELHKVLDDLYPFARYNAATILAQRGDVACVPVLVEMLDLESLSVSIKVESDPAAQTFMRNTILKNAIEAVAVFAKSNAEADRGPLREALSKFIVAAPEWKEQGTVPKPLVMRAEEVLGKVR